MKIYIAGKITGNENYQEQFAEAEKQIKSTGNAVINPSILPLGFEHSDYIHICVAMIDVCDTVYFLPNWRNSVGACIEYGYSMAKEKRIVELER